MIMLLRKFAAPVLRQAATKQRFVQPACAIQRGFGTDSTVPSPVYELRIYRSYPKDFKKTVGLFQEYIGLRVKHSKLVGFWTGEIGDSIFQLVHIWEYDSLSHRLKVRKGMLDDHTWQTKMVPELMPCMESMTNNLMALPPQTKLNLNFTKDPTAVYDLQTVRREGPELQPVVSQGQDEILVGRFWGMLGPTKTEYRLWRYPDIDAALAGSWSRAQYRPEQGSSLLLYPTGFSPMQ